MEESSHGVKAVIGEAIAEFQRENVGGMQLDIGVYHQYHHGMARLLVNNAATFRGRLKDKARAAVKHHYYETLFPDVGNQLHYIELVKTGVRDLLKGSFMHGEKDDQGKTRNFAHPALKAVVCEFFYGTANDCLSVLYPDIFTSVPPKSLALATTAIASSLDEYSGGLYKGSLFTGVANYPIYKKIMKGINRTQADPYHGPKLQSMLQEWAKEARMLTFEGEAAADGDVSEFEVFLD